MVRKPPFEALEVACSEPVLCHVRFVRQIEGRKTDVADGIRLARTFQFGMCRLTNAPPREFR
ncbi:MAG: hypothetical protein OXN97_15165 [Bryobacterales bacterium]|nr:hypothetical protein [Bryobacterales bacterium]